MTNKEKEIYLLLNGWTFKYLTPYAHIESLDEKFWASERFQHLLTDEAYDIEINK